MSEYYQERDPHDGEYTNHLVQVCDYEQELKEKLLLKSYQYFTKVGWRDKNFSVPSSNDHFFIRQHFDCYEPRNNIIAYYFDTISSDNDEGFVVTINGVYAKCGYNSPKFLPYSLGEHNFDNTASSEITNIISDASEKIHKFILDASEIVKEYEDRETQERNFLEDFRKKALDNSSFPVKTEERPKNFFMRLFYKPKSNAEVYAGYIAGNNQAISLLQNMVKFNAKQGHGFAAEMANNLSDRLRLRNAKVIGGDNAKNGADRVIESWLGNDRILIQSKYCKNGKACINECFDENGEYRYEGMQIEVPYDKYDEAVEAMKEKIKEGKIPGVDDPEKAKEIVRQGYYTYEQAQNIARGGNWDAIKFDATNAIIIGVMAGSLSALITFAVSIWNGDTREEAVKKAFSTFIKVCGTVAVGAFLGAQLARQGAVEAILGKRFCEFIAEKIGKEVLEGDEAVKFVAKNLAKAVPVIIDVLVIVGPEAYDFAKGRISPLQLFKNLAVAGAGMGGAWAGAKAGAWIGGKIGVDFGPAGGFIGGIAGALIGAFASKWLLDLAIDDDSKEMVRIITFEMEILTGNYLCSSEEAQKANEELQKKIQSGKQLKIMFAAPDKYLVAQNIIIPIFEEIAAKREKIEISDQEEDLLRGMNKENRIIETVKEARDAFMQEEEKMSTKEESLPNQILPILEELDIKPKNQLPATVEEAHEQEITFSKINYENDDDKKQEAINWMFTFLRLLIKEKCPKANERFLVPSAKFGEEIPAYFNGTINLDAEIEKTFGFPVRLFTASNNYSKLYDLKQRGTLGELAECACKILNKIPDEPDEKKRSHSS